MKNETKIGLDTMLGVGKKKKIAGREYYILPVCIKDMIYVIGNGIENDETKTLVIVDKESLNQEEVKWQLFGLNIVDEERKKIIKLAREKVEMLVEQMAEQWGVTEELKMQDQMEWVRKMNNIRSRAVEIIDVELICV